MAVWKAKDRLVSKADSGRLLPASWTTLYELQALPDDTLAQARVSSGRAWRS
jgi:hypothetical protein